MVYDQQPGPETQSLAYVLPNELRQSLLSAGMPPEKIPNEDNLESMLQALEVRFDEWMAYRLAPIQYVQERYCQLKGMITVEHYPVLEIISVKRIIAGEINNKGVPKPKLIETNALWEGGRNIKVAFQTQERCRYRIEYVAGYDPVPPIVTATLLNLLKSFFLNYQGDPTKASPSDLLAQLGTLTRDLTQVSLPGGISQSFRVGDPSTGGKGGGNGKTGGGGGTELDRALLPLLKFKRQVIT